MQFQLNPEITTCKVLTTEQTLNLQQQTQTYFGYWIAIQSRFDVSHIGGSILRQLNGKFIFDAVVYPTVLDESILTNPVQMSVTPVAVPSEQSEAVITLLLVIDEETYLDFAPIAIEMIDSIEDESHRGLVIEKLVEYINFAILRPAPEYINIEKFLLPVNSPRFLF